MAEQDEGRGQGRALLVLHDEVVALELPEHVGVALHHLERVAGGAGVWAAGCTWRKGPPPLLPPVSLCGACQSGGPLGQSPPLLHEPRLWTPAGLGLRRPRPCSPEGGGGQGLGQHCPAPAKSRTTSGEACPPFLTLQSLLEGEPVFRVPPTSTPLPTGPQVWRTRAGWDS